MQRDCAKSLDLSPFFDSFLFSFSMLLISFLSFALFDSWKYLFFFMVESEEDELVPETIFLFFFFWEYFCIGICYNHDDSGSRQTSTFSCGCSSLRSGEGVQKNKKKLKAMRKDLSGLAYIHIYIYLYVCSSGGGRYYVAGRWTRQKGMTWMLSFRAFCFRLDNFCCFTPLFFAEKFRFTTWGCACLYVPLRLTTTDSFFFFRAPPLLLLIITAWPLLPFRLLRCFIWYLSLTFFFSTIFFSFLLLWLQRLRSETCWALFLFFFFWRNGGVPNTKVYPFFQFEDDHAPSWSQQTCTCMRVSISLSTPIYQWGFDMYVCSVAK